MASYGGQGLLSRAGHRWLRPVILATQEDPSYSGGSGGSWFKASLGKYFLSPYLEKNPSQKRAGGVAQSVGPEFKPQHQKKDSSADSDTE
jgi:hypothetical protein